VSKEAVELASLQAAVDGQARQLRRVLNVLRNVGVQDGAERCFCSAWSNNPMVPNHSKDCLAARRELLALPQEERL